MSQGVGRHAVCPVPVNRLTQVLFHVFKRQHKATSLIIKRCLLPQRSQVSSPGEHDAMGFHGTRNSYNLESRMLILAFFSPYTLSLFLSFSRSSLHYRLSKDLRYSFNVYYLIPLLYLIIPSYHFLFFLSPNPTSQFTIISFKQSSTSIGHWYLLLIIIIIIKIFYQYNQNPFHFLLTIQSELKLGLRLSLILLLLLYNLEDIHGRLFLYVLFEI